MISYCFCDEKKFVNKILPEDQVTLEYDVEWLAVLSTLESERPRQNSSIYNEFFYLTRDGGE